jgi:hypothetical protein
MAILPIDLQTLFTQSNQVGKEQAAQKDAAPVAQSVQASQLAQKAALRDAAVNETEHQEEGPERLRDRERRGAGRRRGGQERKDRGPEAEPPRAADVVTDPDLGRTIDITR